jgi:CHAD domain-containing protein
VAKAAEIEVAPFEPYALAAARVVRSRTEELFAHEEGVLDTSDIERVHDMRVATRRLRAVLEIFEPCFPKGDFKTALRDVKALADALGERRDPDVHIEGMEAIERAVLATNRPGIEALVERLRARQARGNEAVAAALEDVRECELHARLLSLCDGAEELLAP